MKHHFTILLIGFLFMAAACEKAESELTISAPVDRDFQLLPLPETAELGTLMLQFREGIPRYSDTDAFLQVRRAISNANEQTYTSWAESAGFQSLYLQYLDVLSRVEEQAGTVADDILSTNEQRYFTLDTAGIVQLRLPLIYSQMADEQGRLFIGEDLHLFMEGHHFLLDDGNADEAQSIINEDPRSLSASVLVRDLEDISTPKEPQLKVRSRLFTCPDDFVNSTMSRDRIYPPDNGKYYILFWEELQNAYHQMDEQRVDCDRRRCRQRTFSTFYGEAMVTELLGTQYRVISSIFQDYRNFRRKGLGWIRTFPDVRFERVPNAALMQIQYRSSLKDEDGETYEMLDETRNVVYPTTAEEIDAHNGSGEGTWILSEMNQLITYPVENAFDMRIDTRIIQGRTRHRWINRGNDPINDPIAVVFGCN